MTPIVSRILAPSLKGQQLDVTLSQRTLVVGPSASGKSSILNAVELHVLGGVSDLQGRPEVKRRAAELVGCEDLEVQTTPPGAPIDLVYRRVLAALRRYPVQAMVELARFAGLPLTADDAGLLEVPKDQGVAELDAARAVMGRYWPPGTRDVTWLQWYAKEREKALKAGEKTAEKRKARTRAAWRRLHPRLEALAGGASQWVPKRLGKLVVDVGTARSPAFRLGLRAGGVSRFALSGSEWVIAVSALAVGLAQTGKIVNLLAPEDRAMDGALLVEWLGCLSTAPHQIIIQSIHDVKPAKGWSRVDVA